MADYITIGRANEVEEGDASAFDVEGTQVAVARVDGALYAFGDICTHQGCTLMPGGELDGIELTCGCHGSMFSIKTGEVLDGPATQPIEVYPAREMDGDIQIEV